MLLSSNAIHRLFIFEFLGAQGFFPSLCLEWLPVVFREASAVLGTEPQALPVLHGHCFPLSQLSGPAECWEQLGRHRNVVGLYCLGPLSFLLDVVCRRICDTWGQGWHSGDQYIQGVCGKNEELDMLAEALTGLAVGEVVDGKGKPAWGLVGDSRGLLRAA